MSLYPYHSSKPLSFAVLTLNRYSSKPSIFPRTWIVLLSWYHEVLRSSWQS
jgi:hypothetical protein